MIESPVLICKEQRVNLTVCKPGKEIGEKFVQLCVCLIKLDQDVGGWGWWGCQDFLS